MPRRCSARRCSARGTTSRLSVLYSTRSTRQLRSLLALLTLVALATACSGTAVTVATATPTAVGVLATAEPDIVAPTVEPPQPTAEPSPVTTPIPTPAPTPTPEPTPTAETTPVTVDPVTACQAYVENVADLLGAASEQLLAGADVSRRLGNETLSEADAAPLFAAIASEFQTMTDRLIALGKPPAPTVEAGALVSESLELFTSAYEAQAQGAELGDGTLIDKGTLDINAGAELLSQVTDALPDCASGGDAAATSTEFAVPDETSLTIFVRLAESLLRTTDSPYKGTSLEVLTESAHASCRVLLAGGDVRSAIEASIAASPLADQTFAAAEQQYVLLVVTRGAELWCPNVVTDKEAFTAEVITTLVDVFFDS